MVPVVVNRDNGHWIEWVQMVHLRAFNVFLGVSCRLTSGRWSVRSVDLDSGRILNKFKLVMFKASGQIDAMLMAMKRQSTTNVEMQFVAQPLWNRPLAASTSHKSRTKTVDE